jgi:predicted RNase H-like HicB family nuclease
LHSDLGKEAKTLRYIYPVLYTPYDEGYTVTVPDLPGCVTGGATIEESFDLIRDALPGCLCAYEDKGVQLAKPRPVSEIKLENPQAFVTIIDVDTIKYRAETDNKAVKLNVTVPAWLKTQAVVAGINFSQVLQRGLREELEIE